jgi:cephalosporin hydroxylase
MWTQRRISGLWLAVAVLASLTLGALAASWWRTRPRQVINAYHVWYHKKGEETYNNTRWLGAELQKSPLDLWVMQEILYEIKPDVLVEAGTYLGGSAYYFASVFDLLGNGRVITIDIEDHPGKPRHPRITYLIGSSTAEGIVSQIKAAIRPGEKVLVDLDSDHHKAHVLNELRLYSPLVTPGSYLIVEDTHFNGHPILPKFGPGPGEAVQEFLESHPEFRPDARREKFGMTFNPGGYLRRVR